MGKKYFMAAVAAVGMLVLILDPRTTLAGAADGIELCIRSVAPSLFPFFVLSMVLTGVLGGTSIALLRPLSRLVGIPEGGEGLLAVGLLGGYPVGAQSIAQLYRDGQLTRQSARRLLMFCSNAGPAFLFGIVGRQFSDPRAPWALWCIQLLSALLLGALLPGKGGKPITGSQVSLSLPGAVSWSVAVTGQVCGWVVLMRIMTAFLDRWLLWAVPDGVGVVLTGVLELTGGCCNLQEITTESLRFVAAAGMLSFGGLCVLCQTASVTGPLGTDSYWKGKLLQTLISVVMAWVWITGRVLGVTLLAGTAIICREVKKRCSNPQSVGV